MAEEEKEQRALVSEGYSFQVFILQVLGDLFIFILSGKIKFRSKLQFEARNNNNLRLATVVLLTFQCLVFLFFFEIRFMLDYRVQFLKTSQL